MATTKTIQPTGTTITIPAMSDRPDASVFSTDVDRITDAVNAVNSKTTLKGGYVSNASTTTYSFPISALQSNHAYGSALVSAWRSLFLMFFTTNEAPTIKLISTTAGSAPTVTPSLSDGVVTLTFSATIWDGISVIPF